MKILGHAQQCKKKNMQLLKKDIQMQICGPHLIATGKEKFF